ncbi:MAG: GNAT family N-acetyltransferase [bacterium]
MLSINDRDEFHTLRLVGLESHPEAFATDDEDWRSAPQETIDAMLRQSGSTGDRPIWGAFGPHLVGVVGLRREPRPSTRHKASLWGLYVDPNHRRKGVGKELLAELLRHAESMSGLEQIRLVVTADNAAAIALFDRFGFRSYGKEERARLVNGRYYDQVYMCRFLYKI